MESYDVEPPATLIISFPQPPRWAPENGGAMVSLNGYVGCFLGLATGDAFGAPFEGGVLERLLWRALGKTEGGKMRYTDDTQMSMDLARSFLENGRIDQMHLAKAFANGYRWSRGYGPSAAWLLKKIRGGAKWQDVNRVKFGDGSFGNGAAMRAPILAMCCMDDRDTLTASVIRSSEITHAHPLAIEGAQLIALTTYAALHDWANEVILDALSTSNQSKVYKQKLAFCVDAVGANKTVGANTVRRELGNGIAAIESSITAIYFALRHRDQGFCSMLDEIFRLGGDTDTIGAMAGAIWGAFNGGEAIDAAMVGKVENSSEIVGLAKRLYLVSSGHAESESTGAPPDG